MKHVPNEALVSEMVPDFRAGWDAIQIFALSFDGYTVHGSFEKCAEIANARRHETLTDLRTCLFFEQRRWRHYGQEPDQEAMVYVQSLIEAIRKRLAEFAERQEGEGVSFKAELMRRYWEYQKKFYPDIEEHFDRPSASDKRPPVFLLRKANENIITRPGGEVDEVNRLLSYMPVVERHKWFHSMNSSQALALSVFGNLAAHDLLHCLSDVQDDAGRDLTAGAELSSSNFSMEHKIDYLRELRKTSIDVHIDGKYRVAFECKFAETEVGTCSRPRLTLADSNFEHDYCDGTYTRQRARKELCSLTEAGIKYWQYVPQIFKWPDEMSTTACPLHKTYQLVRNILAVAVSPGGAVSMNGGHVVLIYDERNPAFRSKGIGLEAYTQTQLALREPGMLRKCSWQRVVQHIRHRQFLPWLTEQLALKYGL